MTNDQFLHLLSMAEDAMQRATDGIEDSNHDYAQQQLDRAIGWLHQAKEGIAKTKTLV